MYLKDNLKKCTINNSVLANDLSPYSLIETSSSIKIKYEENGTENEIFLKYDILNTLLDNTTDLDIWLPVFIKDDAHVSNKVLGRNSSFRHKRYGIENFLSFVPSFNTWKVSNPDTLIKYDWIINSYIVPFDVAYGLLCWYRNSDRKDDISIEDLSKVPNGTVLRVVSSDELETNSIVIKYNQDTLISTNRSRVDYSELSSTQERSTYYFHPKNSSNTAILIKNLKSTVFSKYLDKYNLNNNSKYTELWISNGEQFSYFNNVKDKNTAYSIQSPSASNSYLSPCLYNNYREIYNLLSIKNIKGMGSGLNLRKARLLKKLCQILSTSPMMDRTTHSYLLKEEIQSAVSTFLDTSLSNTDNEISALKDVCKIIFTTIKDLSLGLAESNLSDNYITSSEALFRKITNKYSGYLSIEADTNLTYKNKLKNGPHIFINQNLQNVCDKTLENIDVFNNQSFTVGNISIATIINSQDSKIILNKNKTLPLYDIAKKENTNNSIFTAGPDILYQVDKKTYKEGKEIQINLDRVTIDIPNSSFLWKQVSGKCLRFSDYNKDKNRVYRIKNSTFSEPTVYIYGIGKYVISCLVTTENGSVQDFVTINVVDTPTTIQNQQSIINQPVIFPREPIRLSSDNLNIICPSLSQIAISKYGLFWPLKSNSYIYEVNNTKSPLRLEGKFRFAFDVQSVQQKDADLVLGYTPNNTKIQIRQIILENMRDNKDCPDCAQCKSFYENIFAKDKDSADYHRELFYPDTFILNTYNNQGQVIGKEGFTYPKVSNKYAPDILSYGGYPNEVIDKLGISLPNHPAPGAALPPVIGNPMTAPERNGKTKHLCYLKPINYSADSEYISEFHKGVFHPNSGWIIDPATTNSILQKYSGIDQKEYDTIKNKTSSLKFNTAHRKTFTFKGSGFTNLESLYIDGINVPNIYSSSINLGVATEILPEKTVGEPDAEQMKAKQDKDEQKEIKDLNTHLGIRNLNNGNSQNVFFDEFIYDENKSLVDPACPIINNSSIPTNIGSEVSVDYFFTVRGSRLPKKIPRDYPRVLQSSEINNLKIEDIEVKLNFLNYVNTKNLIVWLEADLAPEAAKIFCAGRRNKINADDYLYNNNLDLDSLKNSLPEDTFRYLEAIYNMNKPETVCPTPKEVEDDEVQASAKIKLYLLNQDHISHNQYNVSLKFSDGAPYINVLANYNLVQNINKTQNIAINELHIQPTITAPGFNDIDSFKHKQILLNNHINLYYNKFSQFKELPLFQDTDGLPYGATKFTLKVAVIEDTDEMRLYDNLSNNDILSHYKNTEEIRQSSQLNNSLCSWELILHTSSSPKFIDKDALGLIDYDNPPKIPGYNFIANFQDKKHLIPPVNLNAPNNYFNNINLCVYDDPTIIRTSFLKPPEFPSFAILQILAGPGLLIGGAGGGLIGLLGSMGTDMSAGYSEIFSYLSSIRETELLNSLAYLVNKGNYDTWGFGNPEKVLLNISKDKLIWYKLEASIFKYTNAPILNNNKYKFIRLHKDICEGLSTFDFTTISSLRDILDIKTTLSTDEKMSGETDELKAGDIVEINAPVGGLSNTANNGFYFISKNSWEKITKALLIKNLIDPNIIDLDLNTLTTSDLGTSKSKVFSVLIQGSRAYHFFNKNNTVSINEKTYTIKNTGTIIKNNLLYTILTLSSTNSVVVPSSGVIAFNTFQSDVLLVYKPETTISAENLPFNRWGLEKSVANNQTRIVPDQFFSLLGEGSYGTGSSFLRPNILSSVEKHNRLDNIYDIFNNHQNDKYKYNKITFTLGDKKKILTGAKISGKPYSMEDLSYFIHNNFKLVSNDTNDTAKQLLIKEINKIILNKTTFKNQQNFIFIDLKSDQFTQSFFEKTSEPDAEGNTSITTIDYGDIEIENDYIVETPINAITKLDIDILTNRLSALNLVSSNEENITIDKINTLSIPDLISLSKKLDPDPAECYTNSSGTECPQKIIKNKLNTLYNEKNKIIQTLNTYAKKNTNDTKTPTPTTTGSTPTPTPTASVNLVSYEPLPLNGVLPYETIEITLDEYGAVIIKNKTNDDNYWINIDPHQGCSLARDATIKILSKIEYECVSTLRTAVAGGGTNPIQPSNFQHVCPNKISSFPPGLGKDMQFTNKTTSFTYTVPKDIIDTQKQQYPSITSWEEITMPGPKAGGPTRTFALHADRTDGTSTNRDVMVLAYEKYWMPSSELINQSNLEPDGDVKNKVQDIFNLDDTEKLYVQFRNIPRKLRNIDQHNSNMIPGTDGSYYRSGVNSGAEVNNYFVAWHSIDSETGSSIEIPDYYKLQNEMIFRSFFGSVDGIENKNSNQFNNLEPFEWIPYEYDQDK